MMTRTASVAALMLAVGTAHAEYFSYSDWSKLPADFRGAYIAGLYHALISMAGGAGRELYHDVRFRRHLHARPGTRGSGLDHITVTQWPRLLSDKCGADDVMAAEIAAIDQHVAHAGFAHLEGDFLWVGRPPQHRCC